jgi:uncharacterized membrane protein YphA (DoxX/SURF4 family)
MKYLLHFARLFVGNLFIFSGIVKVNDPLGFSYKLEEYFVEFGMDWGWLHEILVPLAAFLCILEIILGVALLVGYKAKETSITLLLMIVFFTILTGASAIFEIVRSCGCFGDAIPLTPWQSFYKDLILLVLILLLFIKRKEILPFKEKKGDIVYLLISSAIMLVLSLQLDWNAPLIFTLLVLGVGLLIKYVKPAIAPLLTVLLGTLGSTWMGIYAVEHLPFKDFRPYAVSKSLPEQMTLPEGAKPPVYENILTYKNKVSGELKEFTMAEYTASKVWEDTNWEWVSTESELIEEGDVAKITDFSVLTADGEDITDQTLAENQLLLYICYDLSLSNTDNIKALSQLGAAAAKNGITVMVLSSAGEEQVRKFKEANDFNFDFFITDGIVLKTMVRSNPGIMYLENGEVKGKWHENDVPSLQEMLQ